MQEGNDSRTMVPPQQPSARNVLSQCIAERFPRIGELGSEQTEEPTPQAEHALAPASLAALSWTSPLNKVAVLQDACRSAMGGPDSSLTNSQHHSLAASTIFGRLPMHHLPAVQHRRPNCRVRGSWQAAQPATRRSPWSTGGWMLIQRHWQDSPESCHHGSHSSQQLSSSRQPRESTSNDSIASSGRPAGAVMCRAFHGLGSC